uniref:Uncharacterized protein n=1 Tax=Parascaris equorum TaxID=6256 RepID=A0A914R7U5_PAREQ
MDQQNYSLFFQDAGMRKLLHRPARACKSRLKITCSTCKVVTQRMRYKQLRE